MGAAAEKSLSESARMRVVTREDVARAARLEDAGVEPVKTTRVILVDEDTGKERAVLVATRDGVFAEIVRYGQRLLCPLLFGEPVAVREDDGS